MKNWESFFAWVAAFSISCLAACGGGGESNNNPGGGVCDSTGFSEVTSSNITLKWKVEGANLKVRVSAPTSGWVAFGVIADPQNFMQGSNLIIGYYSGGAVSLRDDYADTQISHQPDTALGGTDNTSEACGSETASATEIGFTIPLDSGDAYDLALTPGATYNVGLAYAADGADTFIPKHAVRVLIQQAF
jgi:hypothetical protein